MAVSMSYASTITVTESLPTNVVAISSDNNSLVHNQFNTTKSLNASSSPAITKHAAFNKVLTSGAATIDFTALTGTNGATVTGLGLKVIAIKIIAPVGNGAVITITEGAVNGLALFGASFSLKLQPGQEFLAYLFSASQTIGASDLAIDLAGTGSTDNLNFEVVMG